MSSEPILSAQLKSSSIDRLYELYPELANDRNPDWLHILNNTQNLTVQKNTQLAAVGLRPISDSRLDNQNIAN